MIRLGRFKPACRRWFKIRARSARSPSRPFGPIVVSAAKFLADQSTLDKIVGGFDVSDDAANLVAALSTLNADPGVDAITADIGDATLSGGVGVNAPNFSESGWATSLTISEALAYAGAFSQGLGSTLSISSGDTLSLTGTASLSGTTSGAGTLALAGGSATIDKGATISVSNWSISGAGTDVTLDENLNYAGSFSEGAGDTFVLSGGHLLLSGAATFAGGTVDGSNILYTEGTTTVSGLTIGGTVEWENTKAVTQSGGTVTIGDASGDKAILYNESTGTYDIADDSGIGLGSSTASDIKNAGLFEKTGGTGVSTIVPNVTNNGTIEVTSGTLDFQGEDIGDGIGQNLGRFHAGVRRDGLGWPDSFVHRQRRRTRTARPSGVRRLDQRLRHGRSGIERHDRGRRPWVFTGFKRERRGHAGNPGVRRTAQAPSASRSSAITTPPTSLLRPSERKHADNLHRRLWVGILCAGIRLRRPGARAATGAPALAGTARSVTDLGLRSRGGLGNSAATSAQALDLPEGPPDRLNVRLILWRGRSMTIRQMTLCFGLAGVSGFAVTAHAATYNVTVLADPLGGVGNSKVFAINSLGESVGWSATSNGFDAVLWSATGTAAVLQDYGGQSVSVARAINGSGEIAGFSKTTTGNIPVLWSSSSGLATPLGKGGGVPSLAVAINGKGESVGYVKTANGFDAGVVAPEGSGDGAW